ALLRMSPQKQAEIVEKASNEALHIQVKQADARADAQRAENAVDAVARQAGDLARTGQEFVLDREERLEHGRVQVTVRSKPPTLSQRSGCFVATACYGDYSHPAVIVLRRFRDECLQANSAGRAFIGWYYHNSPRLAQFVERQPVFRLTGR